MPICLASVLSPSLSRTSAGRIYRIYGIARRCDARATRRSARDPSPTLPILHLPAAPSPTLTRHSVIAEITSGGVRARCAFASGSFTRSGIFIFAASPLRITPDRRICADDLASEVINNNNETRSLLIASWEFRGNRNSSGEMVKGKR